MIRYSHSYIAKNVIPKIRKNIETILMLCGIKISVMCVFNIKLRKI